MTPITAEWVVKAEADYRAANHLMAMETPAYDIVCFHAQQCVENYLKALLQDRDISFPRTHDLVQLMRLLTPAVDALDRYRSALIELSTSAVSVRYPGYFASEDLAKQVLDIAKEVSEICRSLLPGVG